eukprot:4815595-Prymnesium_polylepis.2
MHTGSPCLCHGGRGSVRLHLEPFTPPPCEPFTRARPPWQTLNHNAGKKVSPFTIPALLGNTASGIIGIEVHAILGEGVPY